MHLRYLTLALACVLGAELSHVQSATAASALSEQDFLVEMPIVLSVSRLAQRLDETPGAMTILDRNFIRMTGARDVVDVLRFVPGFQTTKSFETDAPMATYHGRIDDYANRIQVLVDGRSVYSTYLLGSAGVGWQTLAIEDIERIEVLRGSNSASYGARAFFGVVNIVSRDPRLTGGAAFWANYGENGLSDQGVRLGWGESRNAHKITVDTRREDGLRRVFSSPVAQDFGKNRVDRFNYSGVLEIEGSGEAQLRVGAVDVNAIRGTPGDVGNIARSRRLGAEYMQLDWKIPLSSDDDVTVHASRTRAFNEDEFIYSDNLVILGVNYNGAKVPFNAMELDDQVSVQYARRFSQGLQTVTGLELRNEFIYSPSSFDIRESVNSRFNRIFGSVEWHALDNLVVNAGGLFEGSDIAGNNFAPRLMLNWHIADMHTLRAGYSTAFRTPSPYEKYADVQYYNVARTASLPYAKASGNVVAEKVLVRELGYSLNLPSIGLAADARGYIEQVKQGIGRIQPAYDGSATGKGDFANGDDFDISGFEFQIDWKPSAKTRVYLSQNWTQVDMRSLAFPNDSDANNFRYKILYGAPRSSGSLVLNQQFDGGYSATLMYQEAEKFALASDTTHLYSSVRSDLRLAKVIRNAWGNSEIALTLQNLNVPYPDGDKKFYFDRRAFMSVRVEF